jgi:hypothetical protein
MSSNPLLQKLKLPGRIFQLPSSGHFYKSDELVGSCKNAEIHVQPLSAINEISIKNPDMLFSGRAIEEACAACVTDIIKPKDLLAKDVDALMVFLRLVTYGPHYEIEFRHTCENAKNHSYVIDLENVITSMKILDPTIAEAKMTVNLPNGQVVKLRPIRYQHLIELLQKNHAKKQLTADDMKENTVRNLLNIIQSVDGIDDSKLIEEWIKQISSPLANRLVERIDDINDWGINTIEQIACKDCGEMVSVDIPLNPISFFTE